MVGADYFFANEPYVTKDHSDYKTWFFEDLRIIYDPFFDDYDDVLYVDVDVVANTEDNIFELFDGEVAGVLECDFDPYNKGKGSAYCSYDFERKPFIKICDKYDAFKCPVVPTMPPNLPSKVFNMNSGVMVWSKKARLKARASFDPWLDWLYYDRTEPLWLKLDQFYISAMLMKHDFDVQSLPITWNESPLAKTEDEFFQHKFLHYSGGDWKSLMLEHESRNKFRY